MARVLECPACGARTPLHAVPGTDTFRCERCGQALKVPPTVTGGTAPDPSASPSTSASPSGRQPGPPPRSGRSASAAAAGTAGAAGASSAAAPAAAPAPGSPAAPTPPPRRGGSAAPVGAAATAAAVSATVDRNAPPAEQGNGAKPPKAGSAATPSAAADRGGRSKVAWYWRVVAWIVAVPLGLVLTAWPAYKLNGIRKDDLLDVFVGSGTGRYTRLAALTLIWALVTALLVQLFVEGGRWLARRRRQRRAAAAAEAPPAASRADVRRSRPGAPDPR